MNPFKSIVWAFLLLFVACNSTSSKELTRNRAKSVIEASAQFRANDIKVTLDQRDVEAGIKAGYWVKKNSLFSDLLELTPLGHKYFTSFEPQIAGRVVNCVRPPKPYITEVTGISDAPGSVDGNLKIVEFLVNIKFEGEMNDITKVLHFDPTKSSVTLRRYDDGWRMEQVIATNHDQMSGGPIHGLTWSIFARLLSIPSFTHDAYTALC